MKTTYYFWDPVEDNIVQERDEGGGLAAEYTTEPDLYGNLISQDRDGVDNQFHYDALGSTLVVTDDNEQVADTRAYASFGETTEHSGSSSFPFQFVGQKGYYFHGGTTLCSVRRRHYADALSRWLSVDPHDVVRTFRGIGRPSSYHLRSRVPSLVQSYIYVLNMPTMHVDPSGLDVEAPSHEFVYPVCCQYCRWCCNKWPFTRAGLYQDCQDRFLDFCRVKVDARGALILEDCCNEPPTNFSRFCKSFFGTKRKGFCNGGVWDDWCDQQLVTWIQHAGEAKAGVGWDVCLEWCEKCLAPKLPDAIIALYGDKSDYCRRAICDPVFSGQGQTPLPKPPIPGPRIPSPPQR